MAKKSPELYSVAKTFIWFAITSILLTASLAAIVLMDHSREWKVWQKKFIQLKIDKTKEELKTADAKIDHARLETLLKEHARAETNLKARQKDIAAIGKEIEALDSRLAKKKPDYQNLKQFQDSYKYYFEEHRLHHNVKEADEYAKKLDEIAPRVAAAKLEVENLEARRESLQKRSDSFLENEKALKKEIDKQLEERKRLENRLQKLKPSIAKDVLNAPMMDFIAPTLQVQQIVLNDLYDDFHFAKVQKVDRCTTCHLGIDQKGFEDAPQPLRTHPKPELYLSATSPHPVEKFGCTTCHGGNGHSVSFTDSAHTPRNEEQAQDWKKKYRWHTLEKWDAKMLPTPYVQAACAKCHHGAVEVPQADKLNHGRKIAEAQGCFNCHKIKGFEDRWKVGPDLQHIQGKVDRKWLIRWLHNPKDFRESTKMPRVFHLSNTSTPEDIEKNNAAIEAIAAYLLKNSEPVELSRLPVAGDAVRGEKLVKELGCLGCHSAAGAQAGDHGPELTGLGSKVSPEWLYSWLKDPQRHSPETRMPNLRLSDQEASDITSYLISQKNEAFDAKPLPKAKTSTIDGMILSALEGTLRRSEAEAELARMTPSDKMQFLGKKSISHQGCFTCHNIKGFEDAKPIGAELSNEGLKDLHQFDFGFIHIDHSRHAWIDQKLKDPRIFDQGKVKDYYEKLRMPQFSFTDEEREALITFVLSLTDEYTPLEMQKRLSSEEATIEKGRLLVSKLNCNGCHTLDGKEGLLRKMAEDPGSAPPILDGEGAKVQEKWLHSFLAHPTPIRPWLTTRMPTFDLSDEELDTLVRYFTHLAHEDISYHGAEIPASSPEKLTAGKELFTKLQCAKCHEINANSAAMGASFLAPDLALSKKRLKADWVKDWIRDPQTLQEGTMMPTFFPDGETPVPDILNGDAEEQIQAIRDYLYRYEKEGAPSSENVAK